MTAHALQNEKEKCFEAGMNDHISKPVDPDLLMETLVKWIQPGNRIPDGENTPQKSPQALSATEFKLSGFDHEAGLARVAGNVALYRNLLHQFSEKYAGSADEIAAHLKNTDVDSARSLAHAIKGMAGNLGENVLYEAAQHLELALKAEKEPDIATRLSDFEKALNRTINEIKILEKNEINPPPATGTPSPDLEEIQAAVADLRALIRSDFGAALQKSDTVKTMPKPENLQPLFETLISHHAVL